MGSLKRLKWKLRVVQPTEQQIAQAEEWVAQNLESRPCDECTACCRGVFGIEELKLAMGETCPHVTSAGCGIYPDRPKSCRDFVCAWRQGIGEVEDRPDKTGVVLDHARKHVLEGKALLAREVWPGAFETALPMLYRVAQGGLVFLLSGAKIRRVIGPEHAVYAHRDIIKRMIAGP